ncbi:MAG: phosphonate ABC transporter, permease protein PhnE [Nitriliruptoraceae bacterium]
MSAASLRAEGSVRPEKPSERLKWIVTAGVAAAVLVSTATAGIRWDRLLTAPQDIAGIARLLFADVAWERTGELLLLMWESIAIAWLGTVIASVFAIPLAFFAAENLASKVTVGIVRTILNILRAVPEIIIAIALIPVFGLTPVTGTIAIAIGSIGTLGKLNAEILETIDPGPVEAADAVGASRIERLRWGVLPQAMPEMAAFVLYRFEINIRVSAVLGLVGAGGIGSALAQYVQFRDFGSAGLALLIVILGTIAVDTLSSGVRRRIIAGPDRGVEEQATSPAIAERPI